MASNKHISIGRLGEDIAVRYLANRGYTIRGRNYKKKCGELDIIAEKDDVLHFVEVKAGSWKGRFPEEGTEVYRPEDHVHPAKITRLRRVIQTYLLEREVADNAEWTCDLVVVLMRDHDRKARVRMLPDILL